jgi:arylsulfatase A-like enzyme
MGRKQSMRAGGETGLNRRAFLGAMAAWPARPLFSRPRQPNIVLVLADDMGYGDLGAYGCPDIRTPRIDSIGRRGLRFTQFYSNCCQCTPTRTALLTGRYQHRVGGMECAVGIGDVARYDEAEWLHEQGELGLPAAETGALRGLKSAGYDLACIGKWHLGYPEKFRPNQHGFDEFFGILGGSADYFRHNESDGRHALYRNAQTVRRKGYITDLFAEEAVGWLKRRSERPFFLYLPFTAPHVPAQGPADADKPMGPANWHQNDRPTHARMIERMDTAVGEVLDQLQRMGAADNTIVVFASDNGGTRSARNGPFRGNKGTLWEGGIRVPCLAMWPGVAPEGRTTDRAAMTMDLLPTFVAAAGVSSSGFRFDGVDLQGALRGDRPAASEKRTLFWRYRRGSNVWKAVRDGDMKYVWQDGQEALHDIARDPSERKNLLNEAAPAAGELRGRLAAWERAVAAPRLAPFHARKSKVGD